jgi:hypothetical protein
MGSLGAQKINDLGQPFSCRIFRTRSALRVCQDHPLLVFDERVRNLRDREHTVHRARHDRAPRHSVIGGLVGVLRDDETAFFFHRFQPKAAIGAGSREDHTNGALTAIRR